MELLSDHADALYERLVKADGVALGDEPGQVAADDPGLAELHQHGLVWSSPDGVLHPVAPELALSRLFLARQREVVDQHHDLLADYARLTQLARANGQCGRDSPRHLELLDSTSRVTAVIRELQGAATVEYRAVDVPWLLPAGQRPDGPRRRLIRSHERFDLEDCAPVTPMMEWRIGTDLPTRLMTADNTGLILLTSRGTDVGALIRAPAAVDALIHYFELLWSNAVAVGVGGSAGERPDGPLPPVDRAVLGLMLVGTTDAAIARTLGISPRSVRRRVAAMEERAGVSNRFALGAAAARLGWLVEPPEGPDVLDS